MVTTKVPWHHCTMALSSNGTTPPWSSQPRKSCLVVKGGQRRQASYILRYRANQARAGGTVLAGQTCDSNFPGPQHVPCLWLALPPKDAVGYAAENCDFRCFGHVAPWNLRKTKTILSKTLSFTLTLSWPELTSDSTFTHVSCSSC